MRHKKHQHESQPIICDQCPYAGKSKHLLDLHIKIRHTDLLDKQCMKCSYRATNKVNLIIHEGIIHEGIKFSCEKCGHQTKTLRGLVRHRHVCAKKQKLAIREETVCESQETPEATEGNSCESQECCRTSKKLNTNNVRS